MLKGIFGKLCQVVSNTVSDGVLSAPDRRGVKNKMDQQEIGLNDEGSCSVYRKPRSMVPIDALLQTLANIQLKLDTASGAATALDLRLRIIAQLAPRVRLALSRKKRGAFHQVKLHQLVDAVLEVFSDRIEPKDQEKIKKIRHPRNKAAHGSFVELMIALNREPQGRELDPHTGKRKLLSVDDIIEGVICIERNRGLEEFSMQVNEAVKILDDKILRTLAPEGNE